MGKIIGSEDRFEEILKVGQFIGQIEDKVKKENSKIKQKGPLKK